MKLGWTPGVLINMLERGVVFRVIDKCRIFIVMESNLREICLCCENIAGKLLDDEYRIQELVFPDTLYMQCIQSFIHQTNRSCNETCWYHILPQQMRFQPCLCRTWSETPETSFLTTRLRCPLSCLQLHCFAYFGPANIDRNFYQ